VPQRFALSYSFNAKPPHGLNGDFALGFLIWAIIATIAAAIAVLVVIGYRKKLREKALDNCNIGVRTRTAANTDYDSINNQS